MRGAKHRLSRCLSRFTFFPIQLLPVSLMKMPRRSSIKQTKEHWTRGVQKSRPIASCNHGHALAEEDDFFICGDRYIKLFSRRLGSLTVQL